jgi:hypothetical protein
VDVTRPRRIAAVLFALAAIVSLSACGSSIPSAVGSYKTTIRDTPESAQAKAFVVGKSNDVFSLVISANGHFVMKHLGHPAGAFNGTWSQTKDRVTLSEAKGTTKIMFVALQKGGDLRDGRIEVIGTDLDPGFRLSWSGVRI